MTKPGLQGREAELDALKGIEGVDPEDIMRQVTGETPSPQPPASGTPPPAQPPAQPKSEAAPPADATGILKEIFGDQFSSVEELKKINIPDRLKEADQLRQQVDALTAEKNDLSGKLATKPKSNFANDDVALFNEFVRTTGIKSFDVFNRLHGSDVANMDYMNAIILARQLENPELISKEPQLRKHIEKTYNVDPSQVDEEDLEVNKIGLAQEGAKAKAKLLELKGKLTIPEPEPDQPTIPQWTPEQEAKVKAGWNAANKAMTEQLSKIPIYMPNQKDPFINFVIPKEKQDLIEKNALEFAVKNHMDLNEQTITAVAKYMYSELILGNLDQIAHSIFEKARSMTEKERLEYYHNPSKLGGGDQPPVDRGDINEEEEAKRKVFDAEMGRT
jgi:hypothetical protein